MPERPATGIQSNNRIQYETEPGGRKMFQEYWIHEWRGNSYNLDEHINDLEKAIKKAKELGYNKDAGELEKFRHNVP